MSTCETNHDGLNYDEDVHESIYSSKKPTPNPAHSPSTAKTRSVPQIYIGLRPFKFPGCKIYP